MFESLDDQMKIDAKAEKSKKERLLQYLAIAVIAVAFFGGLILAVRMLE